MYVFTKLVVSSQQELRNTLMRYIRQMLWLMVLTVALTACRQSSGEQNVVQSATQEAETTSVSQEATFYNAEKAENAKKADKKRPGGLEIPAALNRPELILVRDGYTVSYNKDWKIANWVAWHLTKEHTYGHSDRSSIQFQEDEDTPVGRATNDDYWQSRYDRGHLCPAGDNRWDRRAHVQSFLLSNVCPQNRELNKGDWNDIEILCREWARRYGEVYVVTGPVFYDGVKKTIGRNSVAVPDALFKVVLCTKNYARAIGFVVPNQGRHRDIRSYVTSIDDIEQMTGINFFPKLKLDTERRVEAAEQDDMVNDWGVKARYYHNFD